MAARRRRPAGKQPNDRGAQERLLVARNARESLALIFTVHIAVGVLPDVEEKGCHSGIR